MHVRPGGRGDRPCGAGGSVSAGQRPFLRNLRLRYGGNLRRATVGSSPFRRFHGLPAEIAQGIVRPHFLRRHRKAFCEKGRCDHLVQCGAFVVQGFAGRIEISDRRRRGRQPPEKLGAQIAGVGKAVAGPDRILSHRHPDIARRQGGVCEPQVRPDVRLRRPGGDRRKKRRIPGCAGGARQSPQKAGGAPWRQRRDFPLRAEGQEEKTGCCSTSKCGWS